MVLRLVSFALVSLSWALAQELTQQELDLVLAVDNECSAPDGSESCGASLLQNRASKDVNAELPSSMVSRSMMTSTGPSEMNSHAVKSTGPGEVNPVLEEFGSTRAARKTVWFVTRQRAKGDKKVDREERLWAAQCQPAIWDRKQSVVYTCGGDIRNSDANLTAVVYGNEVCAGDPLRTMTMKPGVIMNLPDDIDKGGSWFCMCGFMPTSLPLVNYQTC